MSNLNCAALTMKPDVDNSARGRRSSVLAVTSEIPWPLNTGGHLRTFHLLRAVSRRFRLRLVVPVTPGQEETVEALREQGIDVRPVLVSDRTRWREGFRAAAAAIAGEPYVLYRRHDRKPVRAALCDEARRDPPDALYLDHLDSLRFRPLLPETPAVLDLHNVYSTLVHRAAKEQKSWWARAYLGREAKLLDRVERLAVGAVGGVFAVSEEDGIHFRRLGADALHIVPNGVDCAAYEAVQPAIQPSAAPTILYVGMMSWSPNVSAAQFLAKEVLPEVRRRIPQAKLQIVGRDPTPEVLALRAIAGVEVTGSVPDVKPFLRSASVLAVPLEAGGGTRLKILEAFASRLPVVSTPVGCEGLRVVDGEHLVITAREQFAEGVISLLTGHISGPKLAEHASALARSRYDWSIVGETACAAIATLVN